MCEPPSVSSHCIVSRSPASWIGLVASIEGCEAITIPHNTNWSEGSAFTSALTPDAELRLAAMCATTDGFELAERDLAIRGPGQLFGVRQAGAAGFRFADLFRDLERLELARSLARALHADDPSLSAPHHARARHAVRRVLEQAIVAEESG